MGEYGLQELHLDYSHCHIIYFIGGGDDYFASTLLVAYRKLKGSGAKTDIFWDDKETHFVMVNKADEIIDFLNRNIR